MRESGEPELVKLAEDVKAALGADKGGDSGH